MAIQLSLPVGELPSSFPALKASLTGTWSAGERFVDVGERQMQANVWFHFDHSGVAMLSVRCIDQREGLVADGSWSFADGVLEARFGERVIRSPVTIDGEIICWAGEILVRLPATARSGTLP